MQIKRDIASMIDWDKVYDFVGKRLPKRIRAKKSNEDVEAMVRKIVVEILGEYIDSRFMGCFDIKIKKLKSNKLSIKLQKGNELLSAWEVECV